ncbi:zinc-binding alcohol dehydrogenase family protein [Gracilibacillus caseinilyticus]|uniref:Zinc-binding alcohol dehydrogenase family protein n=1 Tax=Gracilibacillus caseinilyticus TaxID=2932256 RepID=A0ABY4ERB1_9BACI|nr:zinc-binding alcohol dehydrogenase family protein [Gracilibacillus caseinilyticus]UOQ46972.1 zinc-binding alcohol dehydrogenase family protein [Gracilibacillus caseinilyticus]
MECIVCEQPNSLVQTSRTTPLKEKGQAIINIKRIGVCGTDLHAYKGNQPFFQYPRVLGHELAGTVEWIDQHATNIKEGDRVSIIPYLECGTCIACRNNKPNCCMDLKVIGVHLDGGMCEQISVPIEHLLVTNDISLDEAAVLEPLSIGAHAIKRSSLIAGDTVLVIGAGPIGLGVMAFAKQEGAEVIAMDVNTNRLGFCSDWAQVDHLIDAGQAPLDTLYDLTGGNLPSIVFDATGHCLSMMEAFQYTAHGGELVYVGLVKDHITFFDPDFHAKELSLLASRNATRDDFDYVKRFIQMNKINIGNYITHRTAFKYTVNTFNEWLDPETNVIKAIIEL